MGRFSRKETIFYKKLHLEGYNDIDEFWRLICLLRNLVSKEYYSLPYFAIRKSGIDYIFHTHSPRSFISWDELALIEMSKTSFSFFLTSGANIKLNFSALDYVSVQAMKKAFSERGLLSSR